MNTQRGSNSQNGAQTGDSTSSINLRGLGSNQTLILVDGRRLPGVNAGGGIAGAVGFPLLQPDINGIPFSAIERIEVLPSTAGGIYGGGATGGVINIILRRNYSGGEISATYGNTFDSASETVELTANGGFSFDNGRTQVFVSAAHKETSPLLNGDREFAERLISKQVVNNPATIYGSNVPPPTGYTPNILSNTLVAGVRQPLVLDNGTPLNSTFTSIPTGYAGSGTDGTSPLLARAGTYNLDLPNDYTATVGRLSSLLNNPRVRSFQVNFKREVSSRLHAFADFSWSENEGHVFNRISLGNAGGASGGRVNLPANAPNNPFQQAILVSFPVLGIDQEESEQRLTTLRVLGGVILELRGGWKLGADYAWGRSTNEQSLSAKLQSGFTLNTGGNAALLNGTLDIMRDLNVYRLDYSSYLLPKKTFQRGPFETDLRDATVRFGGPLFQLPGGPLTLSGSLEQREESASPGYHERATTIAQYDTPQILYISKRSQKVQSAYVELRGNLYSKGNKISSNRELELQLSARRDNYETKQTQPTQVVVPRRDTVPAGLTMAKNDAVATDLTAGIRWRPIEDLVLRASYGTGVLPPSVNQIASGLPTSLPPSTAAVLRLIDPKRGGSLVGLDVNGTPIPVSSIGFTQGGNPRLRPEQSKSISAGIVIIPRFSPGFRISIDYTTIDKTDEINTLLNQQVINMEDSLSGRIVRGSNLASDLPGWAGPITSVDISAINIARSRVTAFDVQVDYSKKLAQTGEWNVYLVATRQTDLRRQLVPNSAFIEYAGTGIGAIEWRGNGGLNWTRGPWTVGWNMQYYASYLATDPDPNAAASNLTTTRLLGSDRVPAQRYHDVFIKYRTLFQTNRLLRDIEISFGVQNLFNTYPPFDGGLGLSSFADPRLRRFVSSIRKKF